MGSTSDGAVDAAGAEPAHTAGGGGEANRRMATDPELPPAPLGGPVSSGRGALRVGVGIAASRASGLLREVVTAMAFGVGPHADVFRTALRAPNLLQNLLGEGTLSAAFIPIYSRMLASDRRQDAGRFAGAVFSLLLVLVAGLVLAGVLLARPLTALLTPGYLADAAAVAAGSATVDRFELAVAAARLMFPMAGLLVLSAWSLGVLNSHRRFFVPYVAPVLWNAAIIGALLFAGGPLFASLLDPLFNWWPVGSGFPRSGQGPVGTVATAGPLGPTLLLDRLLLAACGGALVGGALQFLVQVPFVVRELRGFRLSLSPRVAGVGEALRAFVPVVAARGAAQLGSYVDVILASFLAAGALGAIGLAQTLYLLPISLFGMSVAAAELPELASSAASRSQASRSPAVKAATDATAPEAATPRGQAVAEVGTRAEAALSRMAFLTVPTVVVYLAFGLPVVELLFRRGRFDDGDVALVALVLAAYAVGVFPTTSSRLLQNVCYATGRATTAARIGVQRTLLAGGLGAVLMLLLDRYTLADLPLAAETIAGEQRTLFLGAVGLAAGSAIAAWVELARLSRAVAGGLPGFGVPWRIVGKLLGLALTAAAVAGAVWVKASAGELTMVGQTSSWRTLLVLAIFALTYLVLAAASGINEATTLWSKLRRRASSRINRKR